MTGGRSANDLDLISNAIKEKLRMSSEIVKQSGRSRTCNLTLLSLLSALVAVFGLAPATAQGAISDYEIEHVSASLSTLEAGRHPDLTTTIEFKHTTDPVPDTESLAIELPPGLTANPQNFKTCSFVQFNNSFQDPCPLDSQIGLVRIRLQGSTEVYEEPLYNLTSSEDEIVRLGFIGIFFPYYLEIDLRSDDDYGVTVKSVEMPSAEHIQLIEATTWGVPADSSHDVERITPLEAFFCTQIFHESGPCLAGGSRDSTSAPVPFVTNPASCGPANFTFRTTAYLLPGQEFTASASAGEITDCEEVPFNPSLSLFPTNHPASAPTGLEAVLNLPQNEAVNTVNASPLRAAKVVLPEGMTVNSSAAEGLEGCSEEQVRFKVPGPAACPNASKLGSAEFRSPALKRPIFGGIYLRSPEPGHLFRFWLVSNELGVDLKIPAEVELDNETGRLTVVVPESPQVPAERVVLRLKEGPRAPLRNPTSCGTSNASYVLTPWSGGPSVAATVPVEINQGCDGGNFNPKLSAGTVDPTAGEFSPLVFDVTREEGEQNLGSVDVTLPKGLAAKFAGVPLCSDDAAVSGSCPSGSQIGVVRAAVGAGTEPLWIPQPGKAPTAVYLAGPYKGAPYSVVAIVPAQAGPFDLGLVSVRSGIYVNPETAQGTVKSDLLPQILQGVPIEYRRVRIEINRPQFTLNPTSCADLKITAAITSSGGATATPEDRFQAADCASLGFSPKLSMRLSGGTRRAAHPRLRAVLRARRRDANIRRTSVALPHSEFLEQAHIRTVCTRVQFAADACPAGSIYGRASVKTPLLDRPLRGPVYLRSSSHELPDLVVDLRGQLRVTVIGRIDSVNGGIRVTFDAVPDAPVTKFVLDMQGGKKGLLVNSTNLCASPHFASVKMRGQNGRVLNTSPPLRSNC